jgi:hypothetical protein
LAASGVAFTAGTMTPTIQGTPGMEPREYRRASITPKPRGTPGMEPATAKTSSMSGV